MNNNPIGIFDSGIGGLSILKEIKNLLPQENLLYIADSKNCPYGGKNPEEVYTLAQRQISYLVEHNVKLIVVACNTVTVSCIDKLRSDFPSVPIIGIVPVVKKASEISKLKRIGILSTSTTSKSEYQADLISKYASDCEVVSVGTDELVPSIENGTTNSLDFVEILKKVLKPFKDTQIDALALGCSHFPLVKDKIRAIIGSDVYILDSGGAVARQVKRVLEKENILSTVLTPEYTYVTTGDSDSFKMLVEQITGIENATIRSI